MYFVKKQNENDRDLSCSHTIFGMLEERIMFREHITRNWERKVQCVIWYQLMLHFMLQFLACCCADVYKLAQNIDCNGMLL